MVSPPRAFQTRLGAWVDSGRHKQQHTGSHTAPSRGRRVLSIADNPEDVSSHRASIAAGYTFQVKNLAYWPIPILPIGHVHARGWWLFLDGWYRTEIIPALEPE